MSSYSSDHLTVKMSWDIILKEMVSLQYEDLCDSSDQQPVKMSCGKFILLNFYRQTFKGKKIWFLCYVILQQIFLQLQKFPLQKYICCKITCCKIACCRNTCCKYTIPSPGAPKNLLILRQSCIFPIIKWKKVRKFLIVSDKKM